MKRYAAVLALAAAVLYGPLVLPANAHNRCDKADHTHRRWTWNRTWNEHWLYLRSEFRYVDALHPRTLFDLWSVDGRTVAIPFGQCEMR